MKHSQSRSKFPSSRQRPTGGKGRFKDQGSHSRPVKRYYDAKPKAYLLDREDKSDGQRISVVPSERDNRFSSRSEFKGKRPFRSDAPYERKGANNERRSESGSTFYDKKKSLPRGFKSNQPFREDKKPHRSDRPSDRRGERDTRRSESNSKPYEKTYTSRDDARGQRPFRDDKKTYRAGGIRERGEDRQERSSPRPVKPYDNTKNVRDDLKAKKPFRLGAKGSRGPSSTPADKAPLDHDLIWGLHAARAAWLNPKRQNLRLWLTESGQQSFALTLAEADQNLLQRPAPKKVERTELDQLTPPGSVHQGVALEASPLLEPLLEDLITGDAPADLLLMLDQVTDPHNVGAILRSASALGARAVIMTERNAPNMTGVLAKSASGAVEHVPQIHVVNLSRTLDELQQAGYWCVGLAEEGAKDLSELDLSGRMVLVMGAEGDGLRQLTRKKCNELARLPTEGAIGSLNVSNAAAIALYETRRQKKKFQNK